MNQFGLIIEETTAGSNLQFVSAQLDRTSPEIKETLTDERTLASQLANLSDVYSVQITKNYKVYSLIVTNLTDFLGRSGYYAIRLYAPKNINLTNFENILASIKEKYNSYTKTSRLNNQNYDDILSSILVVENDRKNFTALKSHFNSFYYFEESNPVLSTVFNAKGTYLVHKLYAFNRNKAVPENIALNAGLKPFNAINNTQKEINIANNYGILKDLKVNEQIVDFNPNLTDFFLLCQNTDTVTYSTSDDKTTKVVNNTFVSIDRKFVPKPPVRTNSPNKKRKNNRFLEESGIYLIMILMIGLIGGGSWYYFLDKKDAENKNPTDNLNTVDSNQIAFEFDGDEKKSIFKTNYKELETFRFRYSKSWQFQKVGSDSIINDGKWKPFEVNTLENTLKLSSEQEATDFKSALSEISGKKFENKTKVADPDPVVVEKAKEAAAEKKPPTSGKGNESKTSPKPKPDDTTSKMEDKV